MAIQKPSIPKGTRDFSPEEVSKRQFIFDSIRHQFQLFGYAPIETPSFENLSTLTGKYGEEGDRLIFKILNSGDYFIELKRKLNGYFELLYSSILVYKGLNNFNKINDYRDFYNSFKLDKNIKSRSKFFENEFINIDNFRIRNIFEREFNIIQNDEEFELFLKDEFLKNLKNNVIDFNDFINSYFVQLLKSSSINLFFSELPSSTLTKIISEKALRYDLTVPFARYVVQHQNEITFPFKRYQMQPVWRADRPQKGRFREFYQCDADVVGSDSLLQEVELISLYDAVFSNLNVPVEIHLNNRKVLSGLAEVADISDKLIDFTVALDKLDKIGEEKVKEEMLGKGIPQVSIDKLSALFSMEGDFQVQLIALESILNQSEIGMQGIKELDFVFRKVQKLGLKSADLVLNLTLARGLDYYTGAILEVKAKNVELGSIGGGGRYDDLTGIFGLNGISGVGISFGLDRIYLVLEELNLFPESVENSLDVLFINFGEAEAEKSMELAKGLRENGIRCEVYPEPAKMKKQMQYADKKAVRYVGILGEEELKSGQLMLKNMENGNQEPVAFEKLREYFV